MHHFAVGGVLMQDGHPIAFESQKLNDTERKYMVQENEMTAIVHCLRIWRHYLLGSRFVIKTDNTSTSYFQTQKKLSPKQARWQDFLAEFDYQLEYKPRKANMEGLEHDPLAKKIIALAKDGRTRRFWLKGDMLFTKGDQLYVPKWGDLRRAILKECHDSKWAGHPGITKTLALVEGTYYWPRMGEDVETFVQTCLIFQQDKIEQNKSGGLLDPLPMPKGPWESISMDFITCLPKSEGGGSIKVVVDRFLKYRTLFIAHTPQSMADDTAKLFFKNVALVDRVVQDYGDGFELLHEFSFLNGRANKEGECTIRALSSSLWKSPFELVTGRQPLTPNALVASYEEGSPAAYKTMKEWHEQVDLAQESLDKAAKKIKKWADEKRRHVEVGDQVMVPQQLKSLRKVYKGLIRRYEGPFPVIGSAGKEDPRRGVSKRAPTAVVTWYDREVEEILSDHTIRIMDGRAIKECLIKWRDLLDSEASWEAEDLLW
ncbi:putative nucleotidyltransferase, ribonuclease H [Tanacetum coccineum]